MWYGQDISNNQSVLFVVVSPSLLHLKPLFIHHRVFLPFFPLPCAPFAQTYLLVIMTQHREELWKYTISCLCPPEDLMRRKNKMFVGLARIHPLTLHKCFLLIIIILSLFVPLFLLLLCPSDLNHVIYHYLFHTPSLGVSSRSHYGQQCGSASPSSYLSLSLSLSLSPSLSLFFLLLCPSDLNHVI